MRVTRRTCRTSSLDAAEATIGITANPNPMPRISSM